MADLLCIMRYLSKPDTAADTSLANARIRRSLPGSLSVALTALLFVALSCADSGSKSRSEDSSANPRLPPPGAGANSDPGNTVQGKGEPMPRVLFLGTSLTAGFGLSEEFAYPARLSDLLAAEGHSIDVVNAGVSGDTSAGGLERIDWLLREPPDWVFVELGANDGLRGLPVEMTEANLVEIIDRAQQAGARTIVAGMLMPPNYGEEYTTAFAELFPRVAESSGSRLVPFLLDGVAGDPSLNLPDGIHPNAEGHQRIAELLLPLWTQALDSTR